MTILIFASMSHLHSHLKIHFKYDFQCSECNNDTNCNCTSTA